MPELPEVETIRRDIEREFVAKRIEKVHATGSRSIRRHGDANDFVSRVQGRTLNATTRRGKYILLGLDNSDVVVVHLGMSGQLLRADANDPLAKHTHVVLGFGSTELRFIDPRTFGEMFVARSDQVDHSVPELAHLGLDPLSDQTAWTDLAALLRTRHTKLKPLLMDQRLVAGIGNMYADEILFSAGLMHDRSADGLNAREVKRLFRSMVETLQAAIQHRGSSLADEQYRDLFGAVGEYQHLHNVYDREGQACPRCRGGIVRVKANGRSTFYCPRCQV